MEEDDGTVRWPASSGRRLLRRRHCFGPRSRTPGNTLTSKEVFTWAKSNNWRLLHVGDIDRTRKSYICTSCSMWLAAEDRVESAGDGGMVTCDVVAFMQVNLFLLKWAFMRVKLLLLNEQMWEAGTKWKTPQSKFVTFETWEDTIKTENSERKTRR
uniref:Uncharacterized protein n=1 Tax=Oryza glumipatula TaxID=40148 RepID=A0A0D9Y4P8_9ORYZ